MTVLHDRFDSPIGPLPLSAAAQGLIHLQLPASHDRCRNTQAWLHAPPALATAKEHVLQYPVGRRQAMDLPLTLQGSPFQQQPRQVLAGRPCGQTCSYLSVGRAIGRPTASRAVGNAVGQNRLSLLPCHRAAGADGRIGGHVGGVASKQ